MRFITLVMRLQRLEELKDTYLQALIYWSEEIISNTFGNDNDKLECLSGIIMGKYEQLYVSLEKSEGGIT